MYNDEDGMTEEEREEARLMKKLGGKQAPSTSIAAKTPTTPSAPSSATPARNFNIPSKKFEFTKDPPYFKGKSWRLHDQPSMKVTFSLARKELIGNWGGCSFLGEYQYAAETERTGQLFVLSVGHDNNLQGSGNPQAAKQFLVDFTGADHYELTASGVTVKLQIKTKTGKVLDFVEVK
eukprot:TRINITY_DN3228_c0_g1_i1.p1 TRINITY_DN3228_c0_g1~~TRINITY_DN3228_c0_g1_i1.p1  ORF type:complete len:200 (-),score=57.07 TRINITY_DN3228_c0_g1_i1:16-549(-)